MEDGLKAGLFRIEDLSDIPVVSKIISKHRIKFNKYNKELVHRQIIRDTINEMVKDVILNTKKNLRSEKIKNIKDVYNSKIQIVNFSNKMLKFDADIKYFLKENMYYSSQILNKTKKGEKIIKALFAKIIKQPFKFIKRETLKKHTKERSICDFIAGMTDRYAINLYNSLK